MSNLRIHRQRTRPLYGLTIAPGAFFTIKVNGQVRQKDSTGNMHYKIDELISYISQYMRLEEGDLILTGTPNGVGPVKGGDKVEAVARNGEKVLAKLQFEVTA